MIMPDRQAETSRYLLLQVRQVSDARFGKIILQSDSPAKANPEGGNTMKPSTKDKAKGRLNQVKGKAREIAGKVTGNSELEGEGKAENAAAKCRKK